ncbi:unnamed protein product [Linum tenue]|uniref:Protein kinase domain-containing protein n=2 Tax=Linum tenue TaxID=586396 RepID=A0AAV0IF78_9ROSI|nr:unnamed protein product [Linum tenue]
MSLAFVSSPSFRPFSTARPPVKFPTSGKLRPPRPPAAAVRASSTRGESDGFTQKSGYLFELSTSDANALVDYNIKRIAAIYRRKPLIVVRRLVQLAVAFGRWFGARFVDEFTEKSDEMFEVRARELRRILQELGPAYVKIAQAVSSRSDLIPPSYLDQLSLLQDRIAPFSTDVALKTIEKELGLPIDLVFSEISPEPIAAASLGQVYQARLRSSGQLVAVKVQRPGVQAAISLDILILRYVAGIIKILGKFNSDLQAVIDEWASSLFREMDYVNEAKNGIKFRELYGDIKDVVVPEMYQEYTTRKVIVMEWIEGQKLVEVKDLYLVEVGVYCSFRQLLECGFYHADPHPGNLLRTDDGKLAYLDFGMMGEFRKELQLGFIEACLHLVNRDYDALSEDFVTLGFLPPTADREAVTNALTGVFKDAIAKGIRNISFGDLSGNLGFTMYKFKFQIPSYFSLVIRSLAVLEGIAISFDPNYKVLGSTYPWIARKVLTDSSPELKSTLISVLYKDGVFRIDRLESLLSESLRAETKKALAKQPVEAAGSKVVVKQLLSFTLTEKGSFIREILLQEVAKGLDALGLSTMDSVASGAAARIPFAASLSPSSMTEEDRMNLIVLRRLFLLLSGGVKKASTNTEVTAITSSTNGMAPTSLVLYQLPPVQEIMPILSVITELPQESQQQLLSVPVDLFGRLLSRATARTIRRVFL